MQNEDSLPDALAAPITALLDAAPARASEPFIES